MLMTNPLLKRLYITFGVPKGSVVGPVFFNLYVTDMQLNIRDADTTRGYYNMRTAQPCLNVQRLGIRDSKFKPDRLEESLSNVMVTADLHALILFLTKQNQRPYCK